MKLRTTQKNRSQSRDDPTGAKRNNNRFFVGVHVPVQWGFVLGLVNATK